MTPADGRRALFVFAIPDRMPARQAERFRFGEGAMHWMQFDIA